MKQFKIVTTNRNVFITCHHLTVSEVGTRIYLACIDDGGEVVAGFFDLIGWEIVTEEVPTTAFRTPVADLPTRS